MNNDLRLDSGYRVALANQNPIDHFSDLPRDMQHLILLNLPFKEIGKIAQLSKKFKALTDSEQLWKLIAKNEKLSDYFIEMKVFKSRKDYLKAPVLDLCGRMSNSGYIDFMTIEDVTAPIMRGFDQWNRPFITLRYSLQKEDKTETSVITVHQKYKDCKTIIASGFKANENTCIFERVMNGYQDMKQINYMSRLIRGEPCGYASYGNEEEPKEINGKSVVQLI